MERDGNGWWTETHADHVEGVHADVGDDVDDLILRHELHLQHRLKEFGIPSPWAIGGTRWKGLVTSEGEKMERCGSDCPAMEGGTTTAGDGSGVGREEDTEGAAASSPYCCWVGGGSLDLE